MIVVDTNVISEAMRPRPDSALRAWLNAQHPETLFLTSVTVAELLFGVAILPDGKRKAALTEALDQVITLFRDRVLAFDMEAARSHAALAVRARRAGRGFPTPDAYIAGIAASRGFLVASRDLAPYEPAGLQVINPFS